MKNIELTVIHDEKEYVFSGEGDVVFISYSMPLIDCFMENKIDPSSKKLVKVNVINGFGEYARKQQKMFKIHDKCTLKVNDDFYTGEYATWSRIDGQPLIIVDNSNRLP